MVCVTQSNHGSKGEKNTPYTTQKFINLGTWAERCVSSGSLEAPFHINDK